MLELSQIYEDVSQEQAEVSDLIRNLDIEKDVIENVQNHYKNRDPYLKKLYLSINVNEDVSNLDFDPRKPVQAYVDQRPKFNALY